MLNKTNNILIYDKVILLPYVREFLSAYKTDNELKNQNKWNLENELHFMVFLYDTSFIFNENRRKILSWFLGSVDYQASNKKKKNKKILSTIRR